MSDLERICKIARMGGCECGVQNDVGFIRPGAGYIIFPHDLGIMQKEVIRDIDAVVRPEMLRAFVAALRNMFLEDEGFWNDLDDAASFFSEETPGDSDRTLLLLAMGIGVAEDRIAWVITNIVGPIEKALEEEK